MIHSLEIAVRKIGESMTWLVMIALLTGYIGGLGSASKNGICVTTLLTEMQPLAVRQGASVSLRIIPLCS